MNEHTHRIEIIQAPPLQGIILSVKEPIEGVAQFNIGGSELALRISHKLNQGVSICWPPSFSDFEISQKQKDYVNAAILEIYQKIQDVRLSLLTASLRPVNQEAI